MTRWHILIFFICFTASMLLYVTQESVLWRPVVFTAHLWHLWFLCAAYKCTNLLTYLLTLQCPVCSLFDRSAAFGLESRGFNSVLWWSAVSCGFQADPKRNATYKIMSQRLVLRWLMPISFLLVALEQSLEHFILQGNTISCFSKRKYTHVSHNNDQKSINIDVHHNANIWCKHSYLPFWSALLPLNSF